MILSRELVQAVTGDADRWYGPLEAACRRWQIATPARIAMFLAQCGHESGGYRTLVESLRYSADALVRTWPNRFTPAEAAEMAYDEVRIGERAYGGRLGNGPEGTGDGFRYRGRGIIQLTGKDNYQRCGEALGVNLVAEPELAEQPSVAAHAAGWFWQTRGCNELADAGDYVGVTRKINGGTNGMADRETWLARVRAAIDRYPLGDQRTDTPQPAGPSGAQPFQREDRRMAPLAIFSTLLPTVLQMFSGKAQAAVQRATGADPEAAQQLIGQLFGAVSQAVGVPIADDKSAIQAVGKLTAAPPETVQRVEDDTLAFLDRMAPLLEKIAALDASARKASDDSHDRAAARADNPNGWALRMSQVRFTQWGLGVAAIVVGVLTGAQMYLSKTTTPDPALMVLLTAIVMGLVNTFRDQTGFSFGGTVDSNAAAIAREEIAARRKGGA